MTYVEALRAAPRCAPRRNVVQARHTDGVEHRVEESEWVFSCGDQSVIQERDDARKSWCGSGCATDQGGLALERDKEVGGLCRDVRVGLWGTNPVLVFSLASIKMRKGSGRRTRPRLDIDSGDQG